LVDVCREHIKNGLVREGFKNIAEKFASPDHLGPTFVADFEEIHDPEARAVTKRDAYERVQYLLQSVCEQGPDREVLE
jgi:lysyl-tRNA synthetase class II